MPSASSLTGQPYRFGPFRLDPLRRLLTRDGEPVPLSPKSIEVLLYLLQHAGEDISKQELLRGVWSGLNVEENNLTYHLSVIRKALGESPERRSFIATIPGYGYRFVAPVEMGTNEAPAPSSVSEPRPRRASWKVTGAAALLFSAVLGGWWWASRPRSQTGQIVPLTFDRAEDTQPDISPDGTRVVFISNRAGRPHVWRMQADGSHPVNLTPGQPDCDTPAWSPDGQRIAYQRALPDGSTAIFVMDANGSHVRRASTGTGARASWSPDSKRVAFQSRRDGSTGIFVTSADGGPEIRLTGAGVNAFDPAWSPDGSRILHARGVGGRLQLFVMDAGGRNARQLLDWPGRDASVPAWAPDGRRIVFNGSAGETAHLYFANSDGTEPARLTTGTCSEREASWSRDGQRIYFESDCRGNADIYFARVPAGTGLRLTFDIGEDLNPSVWGERVAFASNRAGNMHIFVKDNPAAKARQVTSGSSYEDAPAWSPNGAWLAFSSNRTGIEQIYVARADGTGMRQVTHGASASQAAWSRDGTRLAITGKGRNLAIVDLAGRAERVLDVQAEWPSFSPDGRQIAFGSPQSGTHQVYVISAQGGEARAITSAAHPASHPSWSPGGRIAFECVCGFGTQIYSMLPDGTDLRPITRTLLRNIGAQFSADGRRLVFATNRDGNFEIYELEP